MPTRDIGRIALGTTTVRERPFGIAKLKGRSLTDAAPFVDRTGWSCPGCKLLTMGPPRMYIRDD
jgi:hypothetical protein